MAFKPEPSVSRPGLWLRLNLRLCSSCTLCVQDGKVVSVGGPYTGDICARA